MTLNIPLLNGMLESIDTVLADKLALEESNVVSVAAEDAGGLIFLKNYLIFINENLDSVSLLDVHCVSDLDGKNDSAQLVDLSYNTC